MCAIDEVNHEHVRGFPVEIDLEGPPNDDDEEVAFCGNTKLVAAGRMTKAVTLVVCTVQVFKSHMIVFIIFVTSVSYVSYLWWVGWAPKKSVVTWSLHLSTRKNSTLFTLGRRDIGAKKHISMGRQKWKHRSRRFPQNENSCNEKIVAGIKGAADSQPKTCCLYQTSLYTM